jgi:hypothetical protein
VDDSRTGALSGAGLAGGEGRGDPVRALRNGLLELRTGESAEVSWGRQRCKQSGGRSNGDKMQTGWTSLPAEGSGAAMLYKCKVEVGERLIRIPARGCVTDKGSDVKVGVGLQTSARLSGSQTSCGRAREPKIAGAEGFYI